MQITNKRKEMRLYGQAEAKRFMDTSRNATFKKVSSSTITSDNDSQKIKNDEPKDNKDNGKATEDKEKDDTMSTAPFGQYGGKMVTITIIGIITMVGVIMYKKSKNIIIK